MSKENSGVLSEKASKIRLVAFDVDGVMTDGRIYYSNSGDEIKTFHSLDGLGIKGLLTNGIEVALITARNSQLVADRAQELKIKFLFQKQKDKYATIRQLLAELNLDATYLAYLGDDLPDLAPIQFAGLGAVVANAHPFVKKHADMVTTSVGGQGAVREFCDFILNAQNKLDFWMNQFSLKH